jgi:hypothetical protein
MSVVVSEFSLGQDCDSYFIGRRASASGLSLAFVALEISDMF